MAQTREELLRGLNGIKKEVEAVNRLQKKAYETGKLRKAYQPSLPPNPEYSTSQQLYFTGVLGGILSQILAVIILFIMGETGAGIVFLLYAGVITLIIYKKRNKPSKLRRVLEILVLLGLIPTNIKSVPFTLAALCISFFLIKIMAKKSKERTLRLNAETAQRNEEIRKYNDGIDSQIYEIQVQAQQHVAQAKSIGDTWFPKDYYYMDAVSFFISAIGNLRADNVKEMVNLYEDKKHKDRMENKLKKINGIAEQNAREQEILSWQMAFSNIIQLGQLWTMNDIGKKLDNNYYY